MIFTHILQHRNIICPFFKFFASLTWEHNGSKKSALNKIIRRKFTISIKCKKFEHVSPTMMGGAAAGTEIQRMKT